MWSMRVRGWQFRRVDELGDDPAFSSDGKESQFGIQHILVWTSVVAIFLGIGKFLVHTTGIGTFSRGDLFIFASFVLGNSVLALPTIYAMFVRNRGGLWLVGSIVWVGIGTPILLYSIAMSMPMVTTEEVWMFGLLDFLQILIGTVLLYSLRRQGFRFVRASAGLNSSPVSAV